MDQVLLSSRRRAVNWPGVPLNILDGTNRKRSLFRTIKGFSSEIEGRSPQLLVLAARYCHVPSLV